MEEQPIKIHRWLYPLSWIYGLIVEIRNKCFDWGILSSHTFNIPVIGVGNLAVGGTGKTPHIEYLIRLLLPYYKIAMLSRGYRRQTSGYVRATDSSTASAIGDEPYQIFSKFPNITVAVDEERAHGIKKLEEIAEPKIEVVLLDDAFQHRYVKPGLNILLTDYHRLFCDDVLLPAGRLREPIVGKERAHIVIVTKCPDTIKPIDFNIIAKRLKLYPYQRLYFSTLKYGNPYPLFPECVQNNGAMVHTTLNWKEMEVLLVAGIAHPSLLANDLLRKVKRVEVMPFADHHFFTSNDIQTIAARFGSMKDKKRIVVTTEKDAARLEENSELLKELKPYIYVLPVEVKILQDRQEDFNKDILNYVRTSTRNGCVS